MKLKSIEISNYKSIKEPIKIDLTGSKPTVFTGKNGCGKTNILEAIHIALSGKIYYFDGAEDIVVKRTYKLDEAETAEYFSITEDERCAGNLDEIEVTFYGNEPDVKWAKVPAIEISVKKYNERLKDIKARFDISSKKYLQIIEDFLKDIDYDSFLCFSADEEVFRGYYNDGKRQFEEHLYNAKSDFDRTQKELNNLLAQMQSGVLKFDYENDGRLNFDISYHGFSVPQITAHEFRANKMTAHCFGITEETIAKANAELKRIVEELNDRLKQENTEINEILNRFSALVKEVYNLVRDCDERFWNKREELNKRVETFYEALKSEMQRKCYFLDNENSMLFINDGDFRRSNKRERNLNSYNPITDAFDNFLKVGEHYKEGERIKEFNKLSNARKTQIVKILNDKFFKHQKLTFDKDIKYKLELSESSLELFVIEKNGEKTSFNNTSLGRRWYLTYVFVKRLLKKGDCLLIDEPAAFLHPQAQTEFRKEIEALEQRNKINIFYSTHSPNMLSFEEEIYGVEMGDAGTKVAKLDFNAENSKTKLEAIWGSFDFYKDLVFNLSDTTVLVEGVADKTCIEKFAQLLGYDLSDYNVHVCDGEAVLQCFYLLHKSGKKVVMIIDNDNKFKTDSHKKQHPHYEGIIEYIEGTSGLCYFMGEGKRGCLEDLFEDPERKLNIYNEISGKKKISPQKIEKIKSLAKFEKAAENFGKIFEYFNIPKTEKVKK